MPCPDQGCEQRFKTMEASVEKLQDDIHNKSNGVWTCLGRKVGWKQLGTVALILLAMLAVVYTSYSRGQDKQDDRVATVEKSHKKYVDKQTELIIEQKVMNQKLNTVIKAQEEQQELTKRIWGAIRNLRNDNDPVKNDSQ